MCTVSIVPAGGALRLVCNRDERRTRPAALPPAPQRAGPRDAYFPLDPESAGTWIGINDAGLTLTVLNRTVHGQRRRAAVFSRGTIVPQLLAYGAIDAALDAAMALPAAAFEPFRLIAVQGRGLGVVSSDGVALTMTKPTLDIPQMFTSSGLGDECVEAPRRALFDTMVLQAASTSAGDAQHLFHRHRWPQRPEISVLMDRHDARTVSRTVVEVGLRSALLRYAPVEPGV